MRRPARPLRASSRPTRGSRRAHQGELEAAHCWEADDRVPRRPAMTEFRRRLRFHQAQWREANGHPIGSQPIVPRPGRRRGPSAAASRSTTPARPARTSSPPARSRRRGPARRSSSRTRASTTSGSGPTSCRRRRWRSTSSATSPPTPRSPTAPSTPGGRTRPARCARSASRIRRAASIPAYLNSLRAFDAAFVLDLGDGTQRDRRRRHQVPRAAQARDPEAGATCRGTWRSPSGRAPSRRARPTRSRGGPSSP